jgi:hypothetical protein
VSEILCNKRGIIIYGEGNIKQSGVVIVASPLTETEPEFLNVKGTQD